MSVPFRPLVVMSIVSVSLLGCHRSDGAIVMSTTSAPMTSQGVPPSTTIAPTTQPPAPSPRLLSVDELTEALLDLQDLPPGYSEEPVDPEPSSKTFCDYVPPFTEQAVVRRDFRKGGGMSAELLSVALRQYPGVVEAKAAFDAMTTALATCTGETHRGTTLNYALMSAPDLGDGSIGVRMTANGSGASRFFVIVGPSIVHVGGGGLLGESVDGVVSVLDAQVEAYRVASS